MSAHISTLCSSLLCPPSLQLLVKNLQFEDGKMIAAAQYFRSGSSAAVELTEEEKTFAEQMRVKASGGTVCVCVLQNPSRADV